MPSRDQIGVLVEHIVRGREKGEPFTGWSQLQAPALGSAVGTREHSNVGEVCGSQTGDLGELLV